ncbi:MAG: HlyD family efflux transporter periplasmic adaptor subunit [Comamonadaceae bacterium]|nr:MAG: HlyD family efflux transporter periplasmic adaptor subunit [Comamonadaceae bacterium]
MAAALVGYAVCGTYTRKFHASGYVVPVGGVIKVAAPQAGVLSRILVIEGQKVAVGQTLAVLSAERIIASGNAVEALQKQSALRTAALSHERLRVEEIYGNQQRALQMRLGNLRVELGHADAALRLQAQRVALAERIIEGQRRLQRDGFLSEMALQQKEQERMSEIGSLENLKRNRSALLREVDATEADRNALSAKRENELSAIDRSIAALEQDRIESETKRELLLKAAEAGTVTGLTVDAGKLVEGNQVLLNILPNGAKLEANVYLPSRAAGFVHVGTPALLQYQAFPYQKFGSQPARLSKMARVAVSAAELPYPAPPGAVPTDLFYVVTLELDRQTIVAYGKPEPLRPGMAFDVSLALEKRTLIEWIFEPVFSVSGKWAI